MGCDIHMVVERRWKRDDGQEQWVGLHAMPRAAGKIYGKVKWREWTDEAGKRSTPVDHERELGWVEGNMHWLPRSRNYDLFAELASVRGESSRGNTPRGVPDDASALARMEIDSWDMDGHSHSHMLFSEAMPIFLAHQFEGVKKRVTTGASEADLCKGILQYFGVDLREAWGETLDDYRLVFWFDN